MIVHEHLMSNANAQVDTLAHVHARADSHTRRQELAQPQAHNRAREHTRADDSCDPPLRRCSRLFSTGNKRRATRERVWRGAARASA
eukprot:1101299-Pleurochrysis_carterae.AAC.1